MFFSALDSPLQNLTEFSRTKWKLGPREHCRKMNLNYSATVHHHDPVSSLYCREPAEIIMTWTSIFASDVFKNTILLTVNLSPVRNNYDSSPRRQVASDGTKNALREKNKIKHRKGIWYLPKPHKVEQSLQNDRSSVIEIRYIMLPWHCARSRHRVHLWPHRESRLMDLLAWPVQWRSSASGLH